MSQHVDITAVIELRPSGTTEHLLSPAGFDHGLLARRPLEQFGEDHRAGRQVDSGGQGLGADHHRQQSLAKQVLDRPLVLGQDPRMVHPHAPQQQWLQLATAAGPPIETVDRLGQRVLLLRVNQPLPFQQLRSAPAPLAMETEYQRRGPLGPNHLFNLICQQFLTHPVMLQRDSPFIRGDQGQPTLVTGPQPAQETRRVADRGREQEQAG